jgi:hypothetical protein
VKNVFIILLMFIFSFQSFYSAGFTAWFYFNRTSIAQKLCINKAKPEMKCNGKCYLKKKLKEAESKNEEQSPQQIKEWVSIAPFIISSNSFQFNPATQSYIFIPQMENEYNSHIHFAIFHPPILS